MKALLLFTTGLVLATRALAQSYSIDWFTIDGGGGTSTSGVFSVSGTIGQPDASGALTNGQYSVTGGFWGIIAAIQTPGAPILTITRSNSFAIVSWADTGAAFRLETLG